MLCTAHLELLQRRQEAALEPRQLLQAQDSQAGAAAWQLLEAGSCQLEVPEDLQLLQTGAGDVLVKPAQLAEAACRIIACRQAAVSSNMLGAAAQDACFQAKAAVRQVAPADRACD